MSHPIRIGAKLVPQDTSIAALRAFWRLADESGFDHLWVYDHLAGAGNAAIATPEPAVDVFDGWTLLAAMASETRHARLGCMVTANSFRHPGVLAKIATTVDHLSHGRLEFGIGTGWGEYEHTMFDLPLEPPRERIEKLDEALRVITALWSPEVYSTFHGKHYRLTEAVHSPKPFQQPRPPIWLGGTGEKRMLELVAKHADVWNTVDKAGPQEGVRLSGVLDRWCAEVGRDPHLIRRSVQLKPDPKRVAEHITPWLEAGFTEIVLFIAPDQPLADLEQIAEQLPTLRS
ncbi:TIGR03560 family F420-dependent LLM class oxidoreductase [Nocardia terpenica]|uniref:TIGR03560 family F420-dependent LLM class oxidoreductase n=1 Tax=Nocardia terpenica TaxID=455432 RepID=A0A6G9Z3S3_9NOCA|nr:TIGR03560 family F420-dependent LLM class oxidoreductase [Nocardia terpenica]QIS20090.1 TIGR03560 family F420-dependent LLM class oxidoreductase [Nocardia terpenica]